jgi:hypothetical protein
MLQLYELWLYFLKYKWPRLDFQIYKLFSVIKLKEMIAEKLSIVYFLLYNLLQHTDDSATFMDIRPSKIHFQRGMAWKGTE